MSDFVYVITQFGISTSHSDWPGVCVGERENTLNLTLVKGAGAAQFMTMYLESQYGKEQYLNCTGSNSFDKKVKCVTTLLCIVSTVSVV